MHTGTYLGGKANCVKNSKMLRIKCRSNTDEDAKYLYKDESWPDGAYMYVRYV